MYCVINYIIFVHSIQLIDDVDIRQLKLQWVRSHFGLVSQEPILFDLTIAENIAYGLENVRMEDIINAASRANIHEFIEQLPQVTKYDKLYYLSKTYDCIFFCRAMKQKQE